MSHKYSDKWTKIDVDIGICLGNNQVNFQLPCRFTRRENIAKKFWGYFFDSQCIFYKPQSRFAFAAQRVMFVGVRQRLSSSTTPSSVGDSGLQEGGSNSRPTLPEYSPHAVRAVMYRRLM